jgi:uncharacterized protein YjbJ (UPF0337 family)
LRTHPFDGCVPTAEPGWTATPVTLSLAILFVARKAKKGDCGLLAADRVVGSAKKIKGSIKEVAGKAASDAKLEAGGKADKIEGKVQNAVGGLKDILKSTASTRLRAPSQRKTLLASAAIGVDLFCSLAGAQGVSQIASPTSQTRLAKPSRSRAATVVMSPRRL